LSYFRQAIVVGPPTKTLDIVDSHVVRAAYAKYRGDTDGQLAELQAAVERVPDSIKAWRELASFYAEQELWEEAIACFQAWRSLAQAIEAGGGTYEELVDRGSVRSLTDYLDALTAQLAGPSLR
jgi:tetratricopeptide (TPR) repeat protein